MWILSFFVCCALATTTSASTVQFASVAESIQLPDESSAISLTSSDLNTLNEQLLGLSTKSLPLFPVVSDIFTRPRALVLVVLKGIDEPILNGPRYSLDFSHYNYNLLKESVSVVFGADSEHVTLNPDGFTGSSLAALAGEQDVSNVNVKTKIADQEKQLLNIYRLIAALTKDADQLKQSSSPNMLYITVEGLEKLSVDDRLIALSDLQTALKKLQAAIVQTFDSQAIVEVVYDSEKKEGGDKHKIVKRDLPLRETLGDAKLTGALRNMYNVSIFTSVDYPAMFAIFAGLIIMFTLAVLYIAVGIWNMDPGRDSIIYRMTATRMKKD